MILCVTGPMAAGKNFASAILEQEDFICLDADLVGHDAVEKCSDKIIKEFSFIAQQKNIELKNSDGTINRKNLGKLIFENKKLLEAQEKIVFPYINSFINDFIEQHKNQNIVINATVLYKVEAIKLVDKIIFIDCPFIIRFFRAKRRDKMKSRQILGRFKSQAKLFEHYKQCKIPITKITNFANHSNFRKKLIKSICSD